MDVQKLMDLPTENSLAADDYLVVANAAGDKKIARDKLAMTGVLFTAAQNAMLARAEASALSGQVGNHAQSIEDLQQDLSDLSDLISGQILKAGDSASGWIVTAGLLTNGNKDVHFNAPMRKLIGASSCTVTGTVTLRQDGSSLVSSYDLSGATVTATVTATGVHVKIAFPSSIGGTNNSAVTVDASLTYTFS